MSLAVRAAAGAADDRAGDRGDEPDEDHGVRLHGEADDQDDDARDREQGAGVGLHEGCATGRIRISLTSTCDGCDTAYITARAMSSGCKAPGPAPLSKNGVSTMPGSMTVTRTPLSLRSWRTASPIAVTAHLVHE